MRKSPATIVPRAAAALALASALAGAPTRAAGPAEPLWAYGYLVPPSAGDTTGPESQPPRQPRPAPDSPEQVMPRHLAGSAAAYSYAYVHDGRNLVDWFPGDHPPMPNVVAHGPASLGRAARGCASCHLPTGMGRPENAPVVAQTAAYFLRQLRDFRSGARRSADPRKPNTPLMIALAKAMSDEEMNAAAAYFGSMRGRPWTRVVETGLAPRTRNEGNLLIAVASAMSDPIAGRIVEVPENEEQSEMRRNPRSGFVAYVPVGSIARGANLVATGGAAIVDGRMTAGRTIACAICHGPDLRGLAEVPGIAGRSPSYIARQLYDLRQGTRNGTFAPLMQPVVANLADADFVAIAAYVASLPP